MTLRTFIWVLLFLTVPFARPMANGNKAAIERAIEHLELEKAGALALNEPDTKLRLYYQVRILFLQHLVAETPGLLDRFNSMTRATLQALDKLPDSDPEKEMMMAEVFFLRSVLRAMHQQVVPSALDMKSACTLAYRNHSRFPQYKDQFKLMGVFHVAMSAVPRKLQWLGNVLCFKGDLPTGLRQLERVAKEGTLMPREAEVLLFYFEKNLLSQPEAAYRRAKSLRDRFPVSRAYNYLLLSAHLELRQIDAAIRLGEEMAPVFAAQPGSQLPIWHYSVGKAYFFRLDYQAAIQEFDQFLATSPGKTLRADALYRKGMALLLLGRYPEAKKVFHTFAGDQSSDFDADEYAAQQAAFYLTQEPTPIDKRLYAARNLFDGGYYQRSLDSLQPMAKHPNELSENQRTELHYRLARNYHGLLNNPLAVTHYRECLATSPTGNLWMKVYAYYYLGRMAEEAGRIEEARTLYKTALSFDGYPYQSGLEQRCKAALLQLRQPNSLGRQQGSGNSRSMF